MWVYDNFRFDCYMWSFGGKSFVHTELHCDVRGQGHNLTLMLLSNESRKHLLHRDAGT